MELCIYSPYTSLRLPQSQLHPYLYVVTKYDLACFRTHQPLPSTFQSKPCFENRLMFAQLRIRTKCVYSLSIKGSSAEPRVRSKRYTLLCTANNVRLVTSTGSRGLPHYDGNRRSCGADSSSNKTLSTFFLQPESSLQCSQQRNTCSYPEPD